MSQEQQYNFFKAGSKCLGQNEARTTTEYYFSVVYVATQSRCDSVMKRVSKVTFDNKPYRSCNKCQRTDQFLFWRNPVALLFLRAQETDNKTLNDVWKLLL